ncbi:hypothetical protein ACR82Z_03910 [Mycoplasma sp. 6243]|uniref:hypothetical protein n=1 Tax=Mycoplasma sp. 6243 TaxID=3440865 RepID=UPI003EBE22B6
MIKYSIKKIKNLFILLFLPTLLTLISCSHNQNNEAKLSQNIHNEKLNISYNIKKDILRKLLINSTKKAMELDNDSKFYTLVDLLFSDEIYNNKYSFLLMDYINKMNEYHKNSFNQKQNKYYQLKLYKRDHLYFNYLSFVYLLMKYDNENNQMIDINNMNYLQSKNIKINIKGIPKLEINKEIYNFVNNSYHFLNDESNKEYQDSIRNLITKNFLSNSLNSYQLYSIDYLEKPITNYIHNDDLYNNEYPPLLEISRTYGLDKYDFEDTPDIDWIYYQRYLKYDKSNFPALDVFIKKNNLVYPAKNDTGTNLFLTDSTDLTNINNNYAFSRNIINKIKNVNVYKVNYNEVKNIIKYKTNHTKKERHILSFDINDNLENSELFLSFKSYPINNDTNIIVINVDKIDKKWFLNDFVDFFLQNHTKKSENISYNSKSSSFVIDITDEIENKTNKKNIFFVNSYDLYTQNMKKNEYKFFIENNFWRNYTINNNIENLLATSDSFDMRLYDKKDNFNIYYKWYADSKTLWKKETNNNPNNKPWTSNKNIEIKGYSEGN